ncbi:TadE/TadG family type IV pilus assembly protein [Hominifimenecus sp. rT4P-3]|uniref:TadE/TadG family type IV pilus assembly protein n=1 Tax=Hominifimenecus sp. rT4P-3 TaxID=3242979 RepID=UPI003DA4871A
MNQRGFLKRVFVQNRQGSVTVEAAFVMPLVLGVIFFVITFSLWLRDQTMAAAFTLESVQWTRREEPSTVSSWLNQEMEQLIWAVPEDTCLKKEADLTWASTKGEQTIFGSSKIGAFQVEAQRRELYPVQLLRMSRRLMEWR